ncbi:hypothetical protein [Thermococcus stetteri]|uniref:hypothetical protein n=1 Tax=Thermococcus stetteri TaxID=49900 RepID=UPI001AE5F012|nr:hypothetical protein [Thermococcus stetteri]MBP1911309.1 hypothetical protein [Thermococcus stetteri]
MVGKKAIGLLVAIMVVASAGCLGGKAIETNTVTGSEHAGSPEKTATNTNTPTGGLKKAGDIDLDKIVGEIETYSYHHYATMDLNVTTTEGNITMQSNVSMLISEKGYVDIVRKRALVNSTVTILPDNLTENVLQIVIGNKTYLKTSFGVNVVNFTALWDSHPLKILKETIKEKPLAKYTENGTTVLVYSPPEDVLLPLAEGYLGVSGSNLTITDAALEIRVANDTISLIKLVYSLMVKTSSDGAFGHIEVVEVGTWKSLVRITSINERREVKPPST